jgi:AcrR family transcriptional regulator
MESGKSPAGKERIIEVAMDLFARDGYDSTPVRTISDAAGVSPALIIFHFGSKDGLRTAVEERVVETYLESALAGAQAGNTEILEKLVERYSVELPRVATFLRRALVEGRPIARTFIERLLATRSVGSKRVHDQFPEEDWLVDPIDHVATRLGYLLLAPQFLDILGRDVFSEEELKQRNARTRRTYDLIAAGLRAEKGDLTKAG